MYLCAVPSEFMDVPYQLALLALANNLAAQLFPNMATSLFFLEKNIQKKPSIAMALQTDTECKAFFFCLCHV